MKKIILLTFTISLFTLLPTVQAVEVLFCLDKVSTGIFKKNGKWKTGRFRYKRFIIKYDRKTNQIKGIPKLAYQDKAKEIINRKSPFKCTVPVPDVKPDIIVCTNNGTSFLLNIKKKRYVFSSISIAGYIENKKDPDPDTISAGTCQKF